MDNTKKYIEMCQKAVEIQENYKPQEGDWWHQGVTKLDNTPVAHCLSMRRWVRKRWLKEDLVYDVLRWGCVSFFVDDDAPTIYLDGVECLPYKKYRQWNYLVWLPRQDQLQGMCDWEAIYIIRDGQEYQQKSLGTILLRANSMEQLWLAFAMHEKYNKLWSEEKQDWTPTID